MSFYEDMRKIATDSITEFGQAVTLSRQSVGAYDPATGTSAVTVTTQAGVGVKTDWEQGVVDGTLIKHTDSKLLLSATGITAPELGDTVTVGGVVHTFVEPLKPLSPAGTVVMYECNIRVA